MENPRVLLAFVCLTFSPDIGETVVSWTPPAVEIVEVSECDVSGTAILYSSVATSDTGQPISYSLNSQSPSTSPLIFAVDSSTGTLTYNSDSFNRQQTPSYVLMIQATDGVAASLTVTVKLTQCLLYGVTVYVAGGESAGSTIATCLTNKATSSGSLSFSILSGNSAGLFEASADGSINVASRKRLPTKSGSTYNLVVLVTESATSGVKSSTLSMAVCVGSCSSSGQATRSNVFSVFLAVALVTWFGYKFEKRLWRRTFSRLC